MAALHGLDGDAAGQEVTAMTLETIQARLAAAENGGVEFWEFLRHAKDDVAAVIAEVQRGWFPGD